MASTVLSSCLPCSKCSLSFSSEILCRLQQACVFHTPDMSDKAVVSHPLRVAKGDPFGKPSCTVSFSPQAVFAVAPCAIAASGSIDSVIYARVNSAHHKLIHRAYLLFSSHVDQNFPMRSSATAWIPRALFPSGNNVLLLELPWIASIISQTVNLSYQLLFYFELQRPKYRARHR